MLTTSLEDNTDDKIESHARPKGAIFVTHSSSWRRVYLLHIYVTKWSLATATLNSDLPDLTTERVVFVAAWVG